MKKLFALPLLLVALLVGACDNPFASDPSVTGAWQGSVSGGTVSLTLTESESAINGSGNLSFGSESISLSVSGTNAYPNVSMTFRSTGFEDVNFQGSFTNETTISGTLHGSGFTGESLTLTRQ